MIGMNKKTLLGVVLMSGLLAHQLNAREHQSFDKGWLFVLADSAGMQKSEYADRHWRSLNLPHDYAFSSLFSNLIFFSPMQLGAREGGLALAVDGLHLTGALGVYTGLITRIRELVWIAIGILLIKVGNKDLKKIQEEYEADQKSQQQTINKGK